MVELAMGLEKNLKDRPYNELVWFMDTKKRIEDAQQMQSLQA